MLVGILPVASSTLLFLLGNLGSLSEAIFRTIMMTGFSIALLVSSFPLVLSIKLKMLEGHDHGAQGNDPLVSILVPAYNEQATISRTLESLVNLKYVNKEVIVIDDGSTDSTSIIASWYGRRGVKLLRRPNGGKASALNHGLSFARGEILVTIDSDSMIQRDAIDEVVRVAGSDAGIVAVAGNVKVLNAKSLLTRIQELEYIMAINTIRRAYALFGTVMVIPGAFGTFRRQAVVDVGGYDRDTITEDFDLTVKLLKTRRRVASCSSGIVYTEVPSTLKGLYKQRLRWSEGTFQTLYKHRDVVRNKKFDRLHSIGFPILMLSLFNPFAGFFALGAGVLLALTGFPLIFLEMIGLFLLVQIFVALVAISIDGEDYRLVLYSPFFVTGYKQFVDFITMLSAYRTVLRRKPVWHKIARAGGTDAIRVSGTT